MVHPDETIAFQMKSDALCILVSLFKSIVEYVIQSVRVIEFP